ncbi:MFS transporter [Streptomyces sp. NPDC047017]|uniref:MFS transporter n=1 Tax=Streptomyces sp. NPDC047017 TaxID=3155024 RepID=UPI003403A856
MRRGEHTGTVAVGRQGRLPQRPGQAAQTLLALSQTQAHATATEFRKAAALETNAAADAAAKQAQEAAATAATAKQARTTAEKTEQDAQAGAAEAKRQRGIAEAEKANAERERDTAASERQRAQAAESRAQEEQTNAAQARTAAESAQIVVPLAASLAPGHQRGSVVDTVMSGLLIGIMIARTVAGLLAQRGDWHLVFVFAAALMAVLAVVLRLVLAPVPPSEHTTCPRLLRSVATLVRTESLLRRRMVLAAAGMGCSTVLWTASSFLLADPPYAYGPAVIGLFGLAGVAGAAAAMRTGRLTDRGHGRPVTSGGRILLTVSWPVLAVAAEGGPGGLIALVIGIVALNLAQQSLLISHQSAIYRRAPHARSRVTTALMVSAFAGSTLASALTAALYPLLGWPGVCGLGLVIALAGVATWVLELAHPSPAEPLAAPPVATDTGAGAGDGRPTGRLPTDGRPAAPCAASRRTKRSRRQEVGRPCLRSAEWRTSTTTSKSRTGTPTGAPCRTAGTSRCSPSPWAVRRTWSPRWSRTTWSWPCASAPRSPPRSPAGCRTCVSW